MADILFIVTVDRYRGAKEQVSGRIEVSVPACSKGIEVLLAKDLADRIERAIDAEIDRAVSSDQLT